VIQQFMVSVNIHRRSLTIRNKMRRGGVHSLKNLNPSFIGKNPECKCWCDKTPVSNSVGVKLSRNFSVWLVNTQNHISKHIFLRGAPTKIKLSWIFFLSRLYKFLGCQKRDSGKNQRITCLASSQLSPPKIEKKVLALIAGISHKN